MAVQLACILHTRDRPCLTSAGGPSSSTGTGGGGGDNDDELHTTLLPAMDKLCERIRMKIERLVVFASSS